MTNKNNETMMQFFEWYMPNDGLLWKRVKASATRLADVGFTKLWLPPAYKGSSQDDVGYGVYDLYDLGEFDQKGTIRTKYGTKKEYHAAVKALKDVKIETYADIVLNHKMGADEKEEVTAIEVSSDNRNQDISGPTSIEAWTKFTFPGRAGKYSDFTWNASHFSGTDWDDRSKENKIFRFDGKTWNANTDLENGNYDYLMGVDLDTDNEQVRDELKKWFMWYQNEIGFDAVRLDAVKHISSDFYNDLLKHLQEENIDLSAVGEYWSPDLSKLENYLSETENQISLFDVPLHFNLHSASRGGGNYSMKNILEGTLVRSRPECAVTFVDNHDTEPGQALESFVEPWFKPLAYALILLRNQGLPCVFYGDYYGIPSRGIAPCAHLELMVRLRKNYAYGDEQDYFDDDNIIGFTRCGDDEHTHSGMAVVMSDGVGGIKRMYMGARFAGKMVRDVTGANVNPVIVGEDGWGEFSTLGGNVSIYVEKEAYEELLI